MLLRLEDA